MTLNENLEQSSHEQVLTHQLRNEYRSHLVKTEATSLINRIGLLFKRLFFGDKVPAISQEQRKHIVIELSKAEELARRLISEDLLINEQSAELAETLGEQLNEKFDIPGLAIVLMGSGVHGGRQVRELFGTEDESDFDWGLVSDIDLRSRNVSEGNSLTDIYGFVTEAVKAYAGEGNNNFYSCVATNGLEQYEVNIESVKSLLSTVLKLRVPELIPFAVQLAYYFQPSFPAEINQRNQRYVLGTLQILSNAEPFKWRILVEGMIESWQSFHLVKLKHVGNQEKIDALETSRRHEPLKSSPEAMSQRFRKILEATNLANSG